MEWRDNNNLPRITASHTTNEFFRLCFVDPYPQNLNHIESYHIIPCLFICVYTYMYNVCIYIHIFLASESIYCIILPYTFFLFFHVIFSYFSYTFFFLNVIFHIFLSSARRWRIKDSIRPPSAKTFASSPGDGLCPRCHAPVTGDPNHGMTLWPVHFRVYHHRKT